MVLLGQLFLLGFFAHECPARETFRIEHEDVELGQLPLFRLVWLEAGVVVLLQLLLGVHLVQVFVQGLVGVRLC